ncbi:MAG: Hsp20/alpha crystallin family protein [Desulfomonilaceae bacterium]|nr:Hsp20/alpha crystallin family protein [Desulfomonilaceae bacterium]
MAEDTVEITQKDQVPAQAGEPTYEGAYFTPAVDIYETVNEIVLLADMPGVEADNLDVDLNDDELIIVGRVNAVDDEGAELLSEYRVGNYYRNFRISDVVDRRSISASLSDGVLKIVLPKAAKAVPRKIPISVG